MHTFASLYKQTFTTLGLEITDMDAMSEKSLSRFERKMKLRLPGALREYYLLAGNEVVPDIGCSVPLPPSHWWIDDGKLVFMEDEQDDVVWGVEIVKRPPQDPPVFKGVNGDTVEWCLGHESCSVFLTVMLHWRGAFDGAMSFNRTAIASQQLRERLDDEWPFVGEVNGMRAYSRPGQAICFIKRENACRIFAGAVSHAKLSRMAAELGIRWQDETLPD